MKSKLKAALSSGGRSAAYQLGDFTAHAARRPTGRSSGVRVAKTLTDAGEVVALPPAQIGGRND
jgi:hypothetical protein